ncbi:MAG: hypothetical protein K2K21_02550 [Lachnospiraceae bacterium]|nr:hypothetical protein [Lachnospiraceae bacterium]
MEKSISLKPGYEELASEMIAYADANMPIKGGKIQLILFGWHDFYKAIGYKPAVKWTWWEKR